MVETILLACGAVSSVLYVGAIDVVAALGYPDYHAYSAQMVSELMAVGAPTRDLLVWLFLPYNGLVLAFAAGVWRWAGTPAGRLTAAALFGFGIVSTAGLVLYPMDLRGTVGSVRDGPHIAATAVQSVFVLSAIACGAFVAGRRFRRFSFATLAIVIVFGSLAGFLARPMPGPTPWIGVAERVNIYATMAWIAVLSLTALRMRRTESSHPRSA